MSDETKPPTTGDTPVAGDPDKPQPVQDQAPAPTPPAAPEPEAHAAPPPPPPGGTPPPSAVFTTPAGAPPVSREGGFGRFARNRAVQLAGAGLIGIFIGGGAVATGVAVSDHDSGRSADRSGFSRQWQPPGDQQGGPWDGNGGFGGE